MKNTYPLVVEGIGSFECQRRTLRTEIKIGAEFARLTEGEETIPSWLRDLCELTSTLKVVVVNGPPGWDVDSLDAQDSATYETLTKVYQAIKVAEGRFRNPSAEGLKEEGEGTK